MAIQSIEIEAYHQVVQDYLEPLFPDVKSWGFYERNEKAPAPVVLIQVTDMEKIEDRDDGRMEMMMNVQIHVLHYFGKADARMDVRKLAIQIAEKCHRQQFGLAVSPAEIISISRDPFDKNHDAYEKMVIEINQSGIFGTVEDIDDFLAAQVFVSQSPKIGSAHEEDYQEVTNENIA